MEVGADNLANANSTRTEEGGPYRRKVVHLEPRDGDSNSFPDASIEEMLPGSSPSEPGDGVRVTGIKESKEEPRRVHKPEHPDANEEGYVEEMVDMMGASRAYEANVSAVQSAKSMFNQGLRILQ